MNKQTWQAALEQYVQTQRRANPVPDRATLSDEHEWQCRLIGGEFMGWHQRELPDILRQRAALGIKIFDPRPLIVVTTAMSGLVAMQEILSEPSPNVVCLLQDEFSEWEKTPGPAGYH